MREGVRGDTARDLVVSHGAERCLHYAEALDAQEGIRNRASSSAPSAGLRLPEPQEPAQDLETLLDRRRSPRSENEAAHHRAHFSPTVGPGRRGALGAASEHAEEEIDASSLRVWFGAVTAVTLGSNSLTISLPTPFAKEHIETRFKAALEDKATELRHAFASSSVVDRTVEDGNQHNTGGLLLRYSSISCPGSDLSCDTH